jgi:hypothetical protein
VARSFEHDTVVSIPKSAPIFSATKVVEPARSLESAPVFRTVVDLASLVCFSSSAGRIEDADFSEVDSCCATCSSDSSGAFILFAALLQHFLGPMLLISALQSYLWRTLLFTNAVDFVPKSAPTFCVTHAVEPTSSPAKKRATTLLLCRFGGKKVPCRIYVFCRPKLRVMEHSKSARTLSLTNVVEPRVL